MATTHTYPSEHVHFTWDADSEPVLTVAGGDTVEVETRDVTDGQIGPDSTADALATLDWARVYPLAGPIRVEDAEPGTDHCQTSDRPEHTRSRCPRSRTRPVDHSR